MAGMAVRMAAQKLGVPDATANEIEDIIEREPEKAVLLKEADTEFKDRIKETFKNDWTPKVFGILALLLYGAYVLTVTIMPHDQNDETIISLVLGQLSGILGTMAAFWFSGSSTK